jgi:hypothetical protein
MNLKEIRENPQKVLREMGKKLLGLPKSQSPIQRTYRP